MYLTVGWPFYFDEMDPIQGVYDAGDSTKDGQTYTHQ